MDRKTCHFLCLMWSTQFTQHVISFMFDASSVILRFVQGVDSFSLLDSIHSFFPVVFLFSSSVSWEYRLYTMLLKVLLVDMFALLFPLSVCSCLSFNRVSLSLYSLASFLVSHASTVTVGWEGRREGRGNEEMLWPGHQMEGSKGIQWTPLIEEQEDGDEWLQRQWMTEEGIPCLSSHSLVHDSFFSCLSLSLSFPWCWSWMSLSFLVVVDRFLCFLLCFLIECNFAFIPCNSVWFQCPFHSFSL